MNQEVDFAAICNKNRQTDLVSESGNNLNEDKGIPLQIHNLTGLKETWVTADGDLTRGL